MFLIMNSIASTSYNAASSLPSDSSEIFLTLSKLVEHLKVLIAIKGSCIVQSRKRNFFERRHLTFPAIPVFNDTFEGIKRSLASLKYSEFSRCSR